MTHQNQNSMLSGQFAASQAHHFGHGILPDTSTHSVHSSQNPYVDLSNSVQQLQHQLLIQQQQQAQPQRPPHFTNSSMENVNDGFPKQIQNQQLHSQMQAHTVNHNIQPNMNSSVSLANMQYSPPLNQTSHAQHHSPLNSASSKGIYTTSLYQQNFHNADVHHHINTGQPQPQTQQEHHPNYPYTSHPPLFPPPQPSGIPTATSRPPTQNYPQALNSRVGPSEPNDQVLPAPTYYAPPAKKRRGRPPTHPIVDPGGVAPGLDEEEHTLFGAIRSGRVAPQTVVDDWIEQYKTNREPAMLELIQFFISCSGCKGKVTPEMYSQSTHADIIRRMTEEFDEDSGEYPLIQSSPAWRRFRSNFVEFIQVLIRQCQYSIIYDQCMIDQVISLLTGLTDSQVRAFRHTSTLASMKMMTALVDVALNVSINRDNTQRQYEAERAKMLNRRASDRLEGLMQRRQELEENMEEVKNMLIYLFKGVFVHRYRDSQPEIRAICMQEIGVWMRRYPAMFLDDSYLKYVGWTLFDRVGDVRVQCLRALQPLYEDPALINSLELFTSRFKSRLVDMTLDKETEVAVQAVKLVSCILKHNDSVLEDKDCENIYELVYCTHRPLAQAAGEFLTLKLFEVDSHAPPTKTKKGKRRSENTPLIRDLVQFFIESELHEHAAYLVDSLWDLSPMLRDWEAMLDLLLEEPGRGEEPMDANQETSLIEIMVCCVRQAATGESPVGRQGGTHHAHFNPLVGGLDPTTRGRTGTGVTTAGGGPTSVREARALAEDRARMTEAMITALPALLAKYGESPERAANLLTIPRYMDMELYTTGRHERHLDLLLQAVQDLVERHTDPSTLLACSRLYEVVCVDELSIATKCQTVRGTLLDRLTEIYRSAFLNYFSDQDEQPDQDDEFHLLSALKRIYAFYACHDLTGLDLWDSLIRVAQASSEASGEVVGQAVACCTKAVLWHIARLSESDADRTEISKVRRMINLFMEIAVGYLDNPSKRLSHESFLSVCDLLVVLSRHLAVHLPSLRSLVYTADRDLGLKLTNYLERRVFVDDEDEEEEDENAKFESLHERRTQLAAFCKLVIYNFVPIRAAAPLYKYYIRSFNDFGDIMKSTLAKSREINRVHTARMIAHCLQLCYNELEATSNGHVEHGSEGLQAVKELARRLNLSFGLDLMKIREAMVAFHSEGIQFCVASAAAAAAASGQPPGVPPNLTFLEVVAEFSNKLLRQDKKGLSEYISRVFPNPVGEEWTSLHTYRTTLDPDSVDPGLNVTVSGHDFTGASGTNTSGLGQSSGATHTGTTGRSGGPGRGRGRRQNRDSDMSIPGSDSTLVPQYTSTAMKRRRGGSVARAGGHQNLPTTSVDSSSIGPFVTGDQSTSGHQVPPGMSTSMAPMGSVQ
ncbi:Cohesin subunit [Fasciola hepatica]|uniref:Cohesin subunit n=1 Tax=Fasciola hepatica TaxID=6192 RepID=A0A4E0RUV3_FASHE|nr:Cohesin subunit [Fasciola hepatica]